MTEGKIMRTDGQVRRSFHEKLFGKNKFKYRYAFTGYAMIAPAFLLLTIFVCHSALSSRSSAFF